MTDTLPARSMIPATPLDAIQRIERETVLIEGRTFLIDRPAESDRLLEHPGVKSTFAAVDYLPYWVDVWPAARMLAKWIVKQTWPSGLRALEIGCGLGVPGIAALSMGLHVTFSDCDATALRFATDNARLNGFTAFDTLLIDWTQPPEGLQVPVILASDLIYELRSVAPLVQLIHTLLPQQGVCLLTDQERIPGPVLCQALTERGLVFTTKMLRAGEPGGRRLKGTLYRITQPGGSDPLAM